MLLNSQGKAVQGQAQLPAIELCGYRQGDCGSCIHVAIRIRRSSTLQHHDIHDDGDEVDHEGFDDDGDDDDDDDDDDNMMTLMMVIYW